MNDYIIMVDASADLPSEYYAENNIELVTMTFTLDGKAFTDDAGVSISYKEFYAKMRAGSVSGTSMTNVEKYVALYKKFLGEGKDVLSLVLSSGISGSYNSARLAAEEVAPLFPDRKLYAIDGLMASLGGGLLTDYCVKMRAEGKSIDEVAKWVYENRLNIQHLFTADDLMFLQRGGRISKSAAVLGSIIGVKPMMDVTAEGKLQPCHKKRGRKGALDGLAEWMETRCDTKEIDTIAVSHGDCEEEADYLIAKVKEKFKVGSVIKNYIGPLIGSHSGPGTVALFFYGKKRV